MSRAATPKPKRGRPSKGIAETRVGLYAPRALRDLVKAAAEREGVAPSEWWRQAARDRLLALAKEAGSVFP